MNHVANKVCKPTGCKPIFYSLLMTGFFAITAPLSGNDAFAQSTPGLCQTIISDPDGDGWGWENGASCMVSTDTPTVEFTWCNSTNADPDGDGWGWENSTSCVVPASSDTETLIPPCQSNTADTDGDGWGWENNASCLASSTTESTTTDSSNVTCSSATADPDGDGWGWENGQSCAASSTDTNTTKTSTTGTEGVLCDYVDSTYNSSASVNAMSTSEWTCSETSRILTANGIPDHAVGTFPSAANPNTISEQTVSATYTLNPVLSNIASRLGGPAGTTGYVLNGIKIDAGTGGSCDDSGNSCSLASNTGNWNIEALEQNSFDFGTDENNAHVQPGGVYHYHGLPEGFITKQGGNSATMTLIGWAADGFPIYARYGYSVANDASSVLKKITGSYQLVTTVDNSRPSTSTYALGTFAQDWQYVAGSGDLDECNGREGVTPEFPNGTYHYYATDSYPYFQRCVKGTIETTGGPGPGGNPAGGQPPPQ